MNVYLTFDVEVWCDGWDSLDASFPGSYERYVYGATRRDGYAMPRTLDTIVRHGLVGVFFVEPLFSARFGAQHLETITDMILAAGQDVQLHLHPEWTDEIRPAMIDDISRKRQHLTCYTLAEQTALIGFGKQLLEQATGRAVTAFRSGGFAANRDTFTALEANGITADSSLNACHDHSEGGLEAFGPWKPDVVIGGVHSFPVTVFADGFGRPRPAQVGSTSFREMREALESAQASGCRHFVIVSHNFEMLRRGSTAPDHIVARRFDQLCAFLASERDRFQTNTFPLRGGLNTPDSVSRKEPAASWSATAWRHAEQLARRLF